MDEPIIPSGKLNVNVCYCSEEQNLDVYVIKNGAHPLMGTDWLQMFTVEIFFKSNTLFDISKNVKINKIYLNWKLN